MSFKAIDNAHNTAVRIYNNVSFVKVGSLSVVLWVLSFLLGFQLNVLAYVPHGTDIFKVIPFAIGLILFLVVANMCIVLISKISVLYAIISVSSVAVFLGFLNRISFSVAISVVVFLFIFLYAGYSGRKFIDGSLKIRFILASNIILSKIIVGVAILGSLILFNVFSVVSLGGDNIIMPQSLFDSMSAKFSNVMAPIVGGVDFSKSLRQISEESVENMVEDQNINISKSDFNKLILQTLDQYEAKARESFGVVINPDEKLSSAIYKMLLSKFNNLDKPMRQFVLAGLSLILFLSVIAFSPIIRIVSGYLAFVIYKLLYIFGFFIITNNVKEVETIDIV